MECQATLKLSNGSKSEAREAGVEGRAGHKLVTSLVPPLKYQRSHSVLVASSICAMILYTAVNAENLILH